jgi:putative sugar O-methyltransferase
MKFKGKWLPEKDSYKKACLRLSKNLSNFKRDSEYVPFVGNDTRPLETVLAFDEVVKLPYVSKNDKIGNPILHNGKSAATLRFAKVVQDIKSEYKTVIEIGAGYGGQCLVLKELKKVDYTIIDIPEALELSKAYLKANNVECTFISSDNVKKSYCDLLISDYCLSELDEAGINFYLDNIKFKTGHFAINQNFDLIINRLKQEYKVEVYDETPKTSRHNNKLVIAYEVV